MDLLKIFYYVVLAIFPFGVLLRIQISQSIYLYLIDLLVGTIFLIFIVRNFNNIKIVSNYKYLRPGFILLLVLLISLVVNLYWLDMNKFFTSFLYFLRFGIYMSLIFIVRSFDRKFCYKIIILSSVSIFTSIILGVIQYFFLTDLRNYLVTFGWDKHYYRIFSTFLDPNFAGVIFTILSIIFLGLYERYRDKRLLIFICWLVTFFAILFTYSRSSYLSFIFSTIFYLIISGRKKAILTLTLILFLGFLILPKDIKSEGVDLLRRASVFNRIDSYINAFEVFKKSPILGTGFNTYRYVQRQKGYISPLDWDITHAGAGVSNSFIFVLVTSGLAGFSSYVFFWWSILKDLLIEFNYFNFKTKLNPATSELTDYDMWIVRIVFTVILLVFVHSLFENSLFYPWVMFLMFTFIGIYARVSVKD